MMDFGERKIIIYGAGMVGNLVRKYLEITGHADSIKCFAVSDINRKQKDFYGYKLAPIDSLKKYAKDTMVLVATFPESQKVIKRNLIENGFTNSIAVDFTLYQEMADTYISHFIVNQVLYGNYDILYIASDNNKTSGAFRCLAGLASEMKKRGLKILVALPEYGDGEDLLVEKEIDYTYTPASMWLVRIDGKELTWQERKKTDNFKTIERIKEIITIHNIGLIHSNTTYTNLGALAAKDIGIPIVWHLRENIFEQGYGYTNEEAFYNLINQSSKILVVSDYLKKCYPKLDSKKTLTIYDGIDVEDYYCNREIFQNSKIKIVLVAAIYPLKGQEELLKAAVILKQKGFDFQIDLIGGGERTYIDKLNNIIKENKLTKCVHILGKKSNVKVYYQASDISVICSRSESFGRVCVESQLSGCLTIGAAAGATKEIIDDKNTGLLYERGNYADLALKISYAIANPGNAKKIAKEGQKRAMKTFSEIDSANKIYEVYRDIMA